MPVIRQKMIFRDDLKANPNALYVFADNEARAGLGGQAKEMRGEPNAVGIRTKRVPSMSDDAFWSDAKAAKYYTMIQEDFEPVAKHLGLGKIVVIPADGLGAGLAELEKRAPQVARYLKNYVEILVAYDIREKS